MFFRSSYQTSLIIDFGSTSIGVAVVAKKVTKKGVIAKPYIVFTHREWILSVNKPDSPQFLSSMTTLLDRSLEVIQKKGIPLLKKKCHKSSIDTISCVYASPWYVSQSTTVNLTNDKEVQFTQRVIDTLLSDEVAELHKSNPELFVIDKKVTHIKLNGYETNSPFNKFAKHISATIYMCLVQKTIIKSVEAGVRKRINTHAITHHSFSLASYTAIRNYYKQENFIILDIGGEVSDINIVKEGSLRYEVSFPFGKNYVLRTMGEKNNETPDISLSKIKISYDNAAHVDHASGLSQKLEIIKEKWAQAFQKALGSIESNFTPRTIFITCDGDVEPFFTEIITKEEFSKTLSLSEPFILESITSDLFKDKIDWNEGTTKDVFLSIDSYFIDSIGT